MTTLEAPSFLPRPVVARPATTDDHPALGRLWLLFRHHMSTYTRALPDPDGTYGCERLRRATSDPTWNAWMLTAADHPLGFALTRAMDEPVRVINSFFLVGPARGHGLGQCFARAVARASPGTWTVAYQDGNIAAARFWARVAARLDPGWWLQHRPVPGRPDLPPDAWVTFRAVGCPSSVP
jgi:predicted acetyltransferase